MDKDMMNWLLESDVALQYLVHRDLLNTDVKTLENLRKKIPTQGWGHLYLKEHQDHGHWGDDFYKPKWISSHYTLLELKNIGCPLTSDIHSTIDLVLDHYIAIDGGIRLTGNDKLSDICVNGMFLNYACYYQGAEEKLHSLIDHIIGQQMEDGGFNCRKNRSGAIHSSLHSTLSVLEGLLVLKAYGNNI